MADTSVVSVLIVSYWTADLTRECLASLASGTRRPLEVIVVDNASNDGTAEMIQREFPDVRLIPLERNIGFARGVNLAANAAHGDYLLLLNPDTRMHRGSIDRLVDFAREHQEAGVVGGRTLSPSGEVDHMSCWGRPSLWSVFCSAVGLSTAFPRSPLFDPESLGHWQRDSAREVGVVTGCLLLAPRVVWEQLGGFDERFFMYGEDLDLCLRAARLGFRPMITPDAVITHVSGASSSGVDRRALSLRGKVTVFRKHWAPRRADLAVGLLVLGTAARGSAARGLHRLSGGHRGGGALAWQAVFANRHEWARPFPSMEEGLEGPTAVDAGSSGASPPRLRAATVPEVLRGDTAVCPRP